MIGALSRFLAGLVFLAAPLLSSAQVLPAECVRQSGGACTEWKVHVANGYSPTEEHAYLSWTPDEWSAGLASCRAAPGTSISSGWLWTKKTTEVTGGLCGRLFAINNLCRSDNAGEASKLQCAKWGLYEPKRPHWISVALDKREGLKSCVSIMQVIGGSIAPGTRGFPAAEAPKLLPDNKKAIENALEGLRSLNEAANEKKALARASKYYESYKSFKEAKQEYDDSLENLEKVQGFFQMVYEVGPRNLLTIAAFGAIERQARCVKEGTVMEGGCNLQPGDVARVETLQAYVSKTDAVQCFSAAGDVAASLRRP